MNLEKALGFARRSSPGQLMRGPKSLAKTLKKFSPAKLMKGLEKESEVSRKLHEDCLSSLKRMKDKDKGLAKQIESAYGYAILPAVGKATLVLGAAYGMGEVFKKGRLIGYCGLVQFTLGVQVGGQTFSELVLFQNKEALTGFKHAGVGFAANASAVLVKAGAAATNNYKNGLQIYVHSEGGLMLELAIGLQKLIFRPAALTRGRSGDEELEVPEWLAEASGREEAEEEEPEREEAERPEAERTEAERTAAERTEKTPVKTEEEQAAHP